jgi:Pseudouridylate synthases, 23S RNA-specific
VFESDNSPTFSLVECKLDTGRTHQIQIHLIINGIVRFGENTLKKNLKNKQR